MDAYFRADPCSFFDPHAFDDLGKSVTVTPSTSNYERCELTVAAASPGSKSGSWSVALDFGGTFADADAINEVIPGRYTTKHLHGRTMIIGISGNTCIRAFQLPKEVRATALVLTHGDSLPCKPILLALDTVLAHVTQGPMTSLQPAGPALTSTDLCETENDRARQLLGNAVQPTGFGLHGCQWTTVDQFVSVHVGTADWPPLGFDSSSRQYTVHGHRALLRCTADDGKYLCNVAVDLGAAPVGVQGSHTAFQVLLAGPGDGADRRRDLKQFTASIVAG